MDSREISLSLISYQDEVSGASRIYMEISSLYCLRCTDGSRAPALPQQTEESKKSNTPQMSLVGSDVVALFPSITAERSGRIVREEIQRSEIKFEGLDKDRALAYVTINKDKIVDYEKIVPLLPSKK